jgi:hypothetical protein
MVAVTEGIHPHNSVHPVICNDCLAARFYSNAQVGKRHGLLGRPCPQGGAYDGRE